MFKALGPPSLSRSEECRSLASCAETACLDKPQGKLPNVLDGVAVHELLQVRGHIGKLKVTTALDLPRDILGHILRPTLCRVEGNHPDRPLVLTGKEVLNHRFEVGGL